jgi:hypothetical protein
MDATRTPLPDDLQPEHLQPRLRQHLGTDSSQLTANLQGSLILTDQQGDARLEIQQALGTLLHGQTQTDLQLRNVREYVKRHILPLREDHVPFPKAEGLSVLLLADVLSRSFAQGNLLRLGPKERALAALFANVLAKIYERMQRQQSTTRDRVRALDPDLLSQELGLLALFDIDRQPLRDLHARSLAYLQAQLTLNLQHRQSEIEAMEHRLTLEATLLEGDAQRLKEGTRMTTATAQLRTAEEARRASQAAIAKQGRELSPLLSALPALTTACGLTPEEAAIVPILCDGAQGVDYADCSPGTIQADLIKAAAGQVVAAGVQPDFIPPSKAEMRHGHTSSGVNQGRITQALQTLSTSLGTKLLRWQQGETHAKGTDEMQALAAGLLVLLGSGEQTAWQAWQTQLDRLLEATRAFEQAREEYMQCYRAAFEKRRERENLLRKLADEQRSQALLQDHQRVIETSAEIIRQLLDATQVREPGGLYVLKGLLILQDRLPTHALDRPNLEPALDDVRVYGIGRGARPTHRFSRMTAGSLPDELHYYPGQMLFLEIMRYVLSVEQGATRGAT